MPADNDNIDRLLGKLLAEVEGVGRELREFKDWAGREFRQIKSAQGTLAGDHGQRVRALELKNAEVKGGMRMFILLTSAATTVGGVIGGTIVKLVWGH